jgi:hypothetical protein
MRALICLVSTLLAAPVAVAQIYKVVDANGNVVYTDVPPLGKDATRVVVEPVNSYAVPEAPAAEDAPGSTGAAVDATYYNAVEIVEPGNDAAIRENAGNLVVSAATSPPLRGDHALVLTLDGRDLDIAADGGVFVLTNVDRGSHQAIVKVVDASGATVKQSAPVSFHMLRATAVKPPPARPKKAG